MVHRCKKGRYKRLHLLAFLFQPSHRLANTRSWNRFRCLIRRLGFLLKNFRAQSRSRTSEPGHQFQYHMSIHRQYQDYHLFRCPSKLWSRTHCRKGRSCHKARRIWKRMKLWSPKASKNHHSLCRSRFLRGSWIWPTCRTDPSPKARLLLHTLFR